MNSIAKSLSRCARVTIIACSLGLGLRLGLALAVAAESPSQKPTQPEGASSNPKTIAGDNSPRRERPAFWQGDASLTEQQREAIREALQSFRLENRLLLQKSTRVRREFEEAVFTTPIDKSRIQSKAAEWGQLEGDVGVARAKMIDTLRPHLSAQQLARLKSLRGDLALAERFRVGGDDTENSPPVGKRRKKAADAGSSEAPPAKQQ